MAGRAIADPEVYVEGIEEMLIRGRGSWIATFKDFHRGYRLSDRRLLLYAEGDTYVKGFLLSRIYSFLVGPRRKAYFLVDHVGRVTDEYLGKMVRLCSGLGKEDDYVMLVILTDEEEVKGSVKRKLESMKGGKVGVSIQSLTSGRRYYSDNFIGRSLRKLVDRGFELSTTYGGDLAKAVCMVFMLSILSLALMHVLGLLVLDLVMVLADVLLSIVLGYALYRRVYHTRLILRPGGFTLRRGKWSFEGRWGDFNRAWLHVEGDEEYVRLEGSRGYVDIPTRRIGVSRQALLNFVRRMIGQAAT
ncbi:hypothetical protein B6U99_01190 [Candidatus Geothermarchaeota archaeon ex4572_27]|nr:MAG: hypothetical protein B6U99_01190 [Candidatus Geothermarchaeota archaeon ex4572_27]